MARRNSKGALDGHEKSIVKALLAQGKRNQDIQNLINRGRVSTINSARITEVKQDNGIKEASKDEVDRYLLQQDNWDLKTNLNPLKHEHLIKAREGMICAVTLFNNPSAQFKAETFSLLAIAAWTNLFVAYFRARGDKDKIKTDKGHVMALPKLIREMGDKLTTAQSENLEAIRKIRNAAAHANEIGLIDQGVMSIFQACCLNFNDVLGKIFGSKRRIDSELALYVQFAPPTSEQLKEHWEKSLSVTGNQLLNSLWDNVDAKISNDQEYSFAVKFERVAGGKNAPSIEFVGAGSNADMTVGTHAINIYPHKPKSVIEKINSRLPRVNFAMNSHTGAWKYHKIRPMGNSKNPAETDKRYCHYDKAHGDYTYSNEWVERLVGELSKDLKMISKYNKAASSKI